MDLEGHPWLMAWPWGPCITAPSAVLLPELQEPDSHFEHVLLLMVKHKVVRLQGLLWHSQ